MFDIIIIGGGPAGLIMAENIDPKLSVLLIEKGKIGFKEKYWVNTLSKTHHHRLSEAIVNYENAMVFKTYLGTELVIPGEFVTLCEEKLLEILLKRIRGNGNVEIIEECEMYNFKIMNRKTRIQTSKGDFSSNLIVDSSGYKSRIVAHYDLFIPVGYYIVYGARLLNIKVNPSRIIGAEIVIQEKVPTFIEIIPISHSEAHVTVLQATRYYKDPFDLEELFKFHVSKTFYCNMFKNAVVVNKKFGIIPMGYLKNSAVNNVFFWGVTAGYAFPLFGTTLLPILDNASLAARFLKDNILNKSLSQFALSQFIVDKSQRKLFKLLCLCFEKVLESNDNIIDKLLKVACTLEKKYIYKMLDNSISEKELLEIVHSLILHSLKNIKVTPIELKSIYQNIYSTWQLLKLWLEFQI